MKYFLFSFFLLISAPVMAENYTALILGTKHVGGDLNNTTPGVTFGTRWGTPELEYHLEGGVFYNSYEEVSPILMGGISTLLTEIGSGDVRVGASIGTAYYDTLSDILQDNYNIPNVGGFIPMVAATVSYRIGSTEYRLTTVPPADDTTAIFNASIAFNF